MFANLPDTFESFYKSILFESLLALKLNLYYDNFDSERYNDGIDHSKEFNAAMHAFYFDWFFKEAVNLFRAYSLLDNESSKKMFLHLIAYRLCGHLSVKIPVGFADKIEELTKIKSLASHTPSELPANGMNGKLKHFDFKYKNHQYIADCLDFTAYLFRGQYFYLKDGVSIAPEIGDSVIDGGACMGETALVFSNVVGSRGKVYSFEPVKEHLEIIEHNVKKFPLKNVKVMSFGLSDKDVIAEPFVLGGYRYFRSFNSEKNHVPLRSIDSLINAKEISKIDFIKLDVEGAEMDILRGAEQSIARFKPKLAISIYHKPNDLFQIILYIKNRFPFYSCYIDHHSIHRASTVLYCKT